MSVEGRVEFTWMLAHLIGFARTLGLDVILDEAKRGKQQAEWNATHCSRWVDGQRCEAVADAHGEGLGKIRGHEFSPIGISNSQHNKGYAADLYVMESGAISNDRELYERLGDRWESLSRSNRWLGRTTNDLGHFERMG